MSADNFFAPQVGEQVDATVGDSLNRALMLINRLQSIGTSKGDSIDQVLQQAKERGEIVASYSNVERFLSETEKHFMEEKR